MPTFVKCLGSADMKVETSARYIKYCQRRIAAQHRYTKASSVRHTRL